MLVGAFAIGCSSSSNDNGTGPSEYTPTDSQLLVDSLMSASLGEYREIQVYLPPGYDDEEKADVTYPLIIFLHGANSTPSSYSGFAKAALDNAISSGAIHDVIVAFPNGRGGVAPFLNPFYTNSIANGDYEDFIIDDVIDYMDANYRTDGTAADRAIMGHSMGGYGSMELALKHPDMFAAVAAHSGPIDFSLFPALVPIVLAENGGQAPYTFSAYDSTFTFLTWSMATAFSPDLSASPFPADFPVDSDGNLDAAVFARWMQHDPATLAVQQTSSIGDLAIYFDCGTEDELGIHPMDAAFDDSLTAHGIDHTFDSYSGDHRTGWIGRLATSFGFIDDAFPHPATTSIAFAH